MIFEWLNGYRVGGFDDQGGDGSQPVLVTCGHCGEEKWFTYRDDGGADYTESLGTITRWAHGHHLAEHEMTS